jgi:hypothetical protein
VIDERPDVGDQVAQQGAAFRAVANQSRKAPAVIALAALAVLAVALVTKQVARSESTPTNTIPEPSALAKRSATAASDAAATVPSPGVALVPPDRNAAATPHPTSVFVPVEAGRVQLITDGQQRVSVVLPAGWEKATDWMYVRRGVLPLPLSFSVWRLRQVNTFPCRWASGIVADPSWLDTAEGQARALSSWWGQDSGQTPMSNSPIAPLASKPLPTTMAAYSAWYLEVLIPTGLDLTRCDGGQLILWDSSDAAVRYTLGPSEVNRIWVINSDRGPIVIDAGLSLAASASQKAEIQAIIDSIELDPEP